MKNKNIDIEQTYHEWKDFLCAKGFKVVHEDEYKKDEKFIAFLGCTPKIVVQIYLGNFRTNTETGSCICADFSSCFNKISQCPFYSDVTIDKSEFWECIEILMDAGKDWANNFGRLEKIGGSWVCNPSIVKNN